MLNYIRALMDAKLHEDRGASAVEYGLLVAGIAALVIAAVFVLGGTVDTTFDNTNTCITSKGQTCP